ncbi:unnamed protein product [Acidithrix sp. C25]|nr:unnamed protein product [Acidithrix sp. C25]
MSFSRFGVLVKCKNCNPFILEWPDGEALIHDKELAALVVYQCGKLSNYIRRNLLFVRVESLKK